MKEHLLQIINELSKREYFDDCIIELTINYDSIIEFNKKLFKDCINEYTDIINSTSKIDSYNLTLTKKLGDVIKYNNDWQRTSCIFYSYGNDKLDSKDYASFDFTSSGSVPRDNSLSIEGLQHILDKNIYKLNNLSKLIDLMVNLNKLIDKQQEEKKILFNKFSNLI